jgi:hypothetical protein
MALQVSKVAWIEVCLGVSQTTHDLYGLRTSNNIRKKPKVKILSLKYNILWTNIKPYTLI